VNPDSSGEEDSDEEDENRYQIGEAPEHPKFYRESVKSENHF